MRICILAADADVAAVRQAAIDNGITGGGVLLTMPASESGELPATHWFCNYKVSQEMCDKLLSIQNLSVMEVTDDWKRFLKSQELKLIK